jgi:hypothetical protein
MKALMGIEQITMYLYDIIDKHLGHMSRNLPGVSKSMTPLWPPVP